MQLASACTHVQSVHPRQTTMTSLQSGMQAGPSARCCKKCKLHQHLCRCKACHPGYGFLSENVDFVEALEGKGVAFLGPTADTMRMFSRKHTAREFAESADVPVLPGEELLASRKPACLLHNAAALPLLKPTWAQGGGLWTATFT